MNGEMNSTILDKALARLAALANVIAADADLGGGLTLKAYGEAIAATAAALAAYNDTVRAGDKLQRTLDEQEAQLRVLSTRMLKGVAAGYGQDAFEYGTAGGVRTSERRKPVRTKKA